MDSMLLRTFQGQVHLQCQFVLLSGNEINAALICGDTTRTFYAIQNLLIAAANISKALWGRGQAKASERRVLRDSLGVNDSSPLASRTLRNHFEHFDERLDKWWETSRGHNFVDMNLGDVHRAVKGIPNGDIFRNFDPQSTDVIFWNNRFNLNEIIAEVRRILPKAAEESRKPHWE